MDTRKHSPKKSASPMRRIGGVLLSLVLVMVLLELLLQGVGLLVKEHSWRAKSQWVGGAYRVLALGDSNTYGLYLPAEDAYPAQLEDLWNAEHRELPIEIINLGYPGTNSFRLLDNLPALLDTFQPDMVLLMIGFNDFWTPEEHPDRSSAHDPLRQLLYRSRLYRLFYMATRDREPETLLDRGTRQTGGTNNLELDAAERKYLEDRLGLSFEAMQTLDPEQIKDNPELVQAFEESIRQIMAERQQHPQDQDILNTVRYGDKTFSLGISEGESAGHSKQMEDNLETMIALLRARHLDYFVLNYPTRFGYYPPANKKIGRTVQKTGAPFIDLLDVLHPDCQKEPTACPELLFYDAHATAKGNQLIAEHVKRAMEAYLFPEDASPSKQ